MTKPWYKSLTKWGGILLAVAQVVPMVQAPEAQPAAQVLMGLGALLTVWGARNALAPPPPAEPMPPLPPPPSAG